MLGQYGRRAQTRSDHLKLILRYLDWKPVPAGGEPLKDLEQFLLDRAIMYTRPTPAAVHPASAADRLHTAR